MNKKNKKQATEQPQIYQIKVQGFLDEKWSDWFDGFSIANPTEDETVLTGPIHDQGALHGMLAKIRDLGLTLLSVECLKKE